MKPYAIMIARVRIAKSSGWNTYVSAGFDLKAETCLTDATALLSMARRGTKIVIIDRQAASQRENWEGIATGRPCAWLVAEQRAHDERERERWLARDSFDPSRPAP